MGKLLPSLEATVCGEVLVVDNGSIDSTRQKVEARVGAHLRTFYPNLMSYHYNRSISERRDGPA